MAWGCCKKGTWKGSKDVTGRHTRRRGKKGRRPKLRWLDDVKFDFRNMGVKR